MESSEYVLAFDLGTGECKAILIDPDGVIAAEATQPILSESIVAGYWEQDTKQWWAAIKFCTKKILKTSGVRAENIRGLGFCATMATTIPIDKEGNPLRKPILYLDTRSYSQAENLRRLLGSEYFYETTGNPIGPVPSISKWMWIKEEEPEIFEKTHKFIQSKDFLVLKTTGEISTDYVDASLTMAFDLNKRRWVTEILDIAGIPPDLLPTPHLSTEIAGELTSYSAKELGLRKGVPVAVGTGDTAALLIGIGAVNTQSSTLYLGSSAEIDLTIDKPVFDQDMRIPLRCHAIPDMWFMSATTSTSGSALRWFKEQFLDAATTKNKPRSTKYEDLDKLAEFSPLGSGGLLFLPYLSGGRAPIWDPRATGAFIGIRLKNSSIDFYRSILEGVAFSLKELVEIYVKMGVSLSDIRFSGGGAKSRLWKQIVCDVLGFECLEMSNPVAASAIGVAACVNVSLNYHPDLKHASEKFQKREQMCIPNPENKAKYEQLFKVYSKSYPALAEIMHSLSDFSF